MPYKSDKQRRYLHARHPKIAAKWDRTYGGDVRKQVKFMPKKKREGKG